MRAEGYRAGVLAAAVMVIVGCAGPSSSPPHSAAAEPSRPPTASPTTRAPSPSTAEPAESAGSAGEPVRIKLNGAGPIGMAIVDGIGWVSAIESGELIGVDLATQHEVARVAIGPGGTSVTALDKGDLAISRIGMDSGPNLVFVAGPDHAISGLATAPLGGLAFAEDGTLWVLEKSGRILQVDPTRRKVLRTVDGSLPNDQHIEIVTGAGASWVSADGTPVRRIAADGKVAADIETGGGIPLDVDGGLIWGARPDELWAIDPATNTVTRHVALDGLDEILAMDVSGTDVWIAGRRPGRVGIVVRLELPSGRLIAEAPASLPAAVELTDDRAWVTDNETGELLGFER